MSVIKLTPSFKSYLWGGRKLIDGYHKECSEDILAETWELSCHTDGPSYISDGEYKGKTLKEYIEIKSKKILGQKCEKFEDFPILIKFIDAKQDLSVQVHPDNQYALKNEKQYGKTEMWYVVECEEGACLYYGFKYKISKNEFEKRIKENTLLEVLNEIQVHKGDTFFIESGTIHAIGKGIVIAEIQQNSNITYRVFDYGRKDKDGKLRDLHIEKALDVTKCSPVKVDKTCYPHLGKCEYFQVDKLNLDGRIYERVTGVVDASSFVSILITDGKGIIRCGSEIVNFQKGDSLFIEADSGLYEIEGCCEAVVTSIA